ncbi:MAG: DUF3810 domain-containing protein [Ruminococcaceae bacterium]|nr:DUF3810 domain-containing protein [Oscillospiraceae bacterium]
MNAAKRTVTEERPHTPVKNRLPLFALIFYGIALLSAVLYLLFLVSERFADFFNRYISSVLRAALAHLTNLIPFSLAEFLLLLLPVLLFVVVRIGLRHYADSWRRVFLFCASVLSVAALLLALFALGFAPAYRGTTLDKKLALDRRDVSAEELYDTAMTLSRQIAKESEAITYSPATDFSVMPYGYEEMNARLLSAYDEICDEYAFIQRLNSRLKPVMLSKAMSYTHITGVYSFFTGEANINVDFPDYTIPYTAAHELSHQRGIAREDEANFMAFLVCIRSEDAYIRYSGYLNLYEYVASALYSASPTLYWEVYGTLPRSVTKEMAAYSDFFDQYRESVASEVSETVNNTFLTIQGTPGTKSYGMVVDLAVAYYRDTP